VDNQVEEIKRRLDIVDTIGKFITLTKRGRHHVACCPFHQEKTPSFTVSPELQIFKCFGCGKSGDILTFVQEFNRVSFPEALEDLAKMAGITLERPKEILKADSRRQALLAINAEVARFYHYMLTTHLLGEPARTYLASRGLAASTIKSFKLGFAPDNPALILAYLAKKGYSESDLVASGTFGYSSYGSGLYDRFRSRLIFPQIDYRDRVVAFSGRVLPGAASNQAKYINSPETDVYHKSQMVFGLNLTRDSIKKSGIAVVVEGEFDLISPYQSGFTNFVAIKGTAFTTDQLTLLHRYAQTLILGLDADFAGSNAALKSIIEAENLGFDLKVLNLDSRFKDPDEAVSADKSLFGQSLATAIPVWDFVINTALKSYDTGTIQGKKQALALVLPFLSKISNAVIRSDYLKKFADLIGSSESAVALESAKYAISASPSPSPSSSHPTPSLTELEARLEEACLVILFSAQKPFALTSRLASRLSQFSSPIYAPIVRQLLDSDPSAHFDPLDFRQTLPPQFHQIFENIYLQAVSLTLTPGQRRFKLRLAFNRWETDKLKKQLSFLAGQIRKQDATSASASSDELEAESQKILTRLSKIQTQI